MNLPMSNKDILRELKQYVKLLELHGANDFKLRSWQNAIQRLERYPESLATMTTDELQEIDGVGKSVAAAVGEITQSGHLTALDELIANTPDGILELLRFRGLGSKKLRVFWQKYGITDKHQLIALLQSGKLLQEKGFGPKTINNLLTVVSYAIDNSGKQYYIAARQTGEQLLTELQNLLPEVPMSFTGKLRRKWEVVDKIEILVAAPLRQLQEALASVNWLVYDKKASGPFSWQGHLLTDPGSKVAIYPTAAEQYANQLLLRTGAEQHLQIAVGESTFKEHIKSRSWPDEEACYAAAGMPWCPPELREGDWEIAALQAGRLPQLLCTEELQGIIHCHTTYSDGQNTVSEMAEACRQQGYHYLAVTDHSKAANFYANGMFEETVARQQAEIDRLNEQMAPFRIFKGIEADILADGSLDYDSKTLATFDLVIASVHSGLNMDKIKATERLIRAIANPFTTILGHLTGRLLLERPGYEVDHQAIINACAEFEVIIEINAHPRRLDLDWRWVHRALDKGVLLSINPDAHEIAGFDHMQYGVAVARKGGLTAAQTFNAWPLAKVEAYLQNRKQKAGS